MNCTEAREILPAYAGDGEENLALRRHLARCAECRAEAKGYEAMATGLDALAGSTVEPPPALLGALVAIPERVDKVTAVKDHVARNRKRYAGGLAVALVGAAAGAVVLTRRPRAA